MSKDFVEVEMVANLSQYETEVDRLNAKTDEYTMKMRVARQEAVNLAQDAIRSIGYIQQAYREVLSAMGRTLDPLQSSMLNMITTSTSTMLSIATAMASTGLLAAVAVGLAIVALEVEAIQTAKVIAEVAGARDQIADARRRMRDIQSRRTVIGGSF